MVGKCGERIHRFTVEQDVELCQLRRAERVNMIVERGISLRYRLQLVVEINHYLAERNHEYQLYAVAADILLLDELAPLVETELHYRAYEIGIGDDACTDIRLLDMLYHRGIGQPRRIMHFVHATLFVVNHVGNIGHGGDNIHVELSVQALLHNLHVEQSEEATTETEAEGNG